MWGPGSYFRPYRSRWGPDKKKKSRWGEDLEPADPASPASPESPTEPNQRKRSRSNAASSPASPVEDIADNPAQRRYVSVVNPCWLGPCMAGGSWCKHSQGVGEWQPDLEVEVARVRGTGPPGMENG